MRRCATPISLFGRCDARPMESLRSTACGQAAITRSHSTASAKRCSRMWNSYAKSYRVRYGSKCGRGRRRISTWFRRCGRTTDLGIMGELPEPWMRGPLEGVHPLLAPVLYSFQMAREDLEKFTAGLGSAEIWETPHGLTSVGFHLRHIAGSRDGLVTYLPAGDLTTAHYEVAAEER